MAFEIQRDDSVTQNARVLLEVKLPDDDTNYKFAVRRLRSSSLIAVKAEARKSRDSKSLASLEMLAELASTIEPLDGTIDFSEFITKVGDVGGDSGTMSLVEHIITLATSDVAKLKSEGAHVW